MDVSIIIVNYNTKDLLFQCLDSLYKNISGLEFEIIVVDNYSKENIDVIKAVFPKVQLIKSEINLGFGKANNLGYKYANGEYVFLLNPDTIVLNNAVRILFDFMQAHKEISICGGQLFDADMRKVHSFCLFLPSVLWEINIFACQYLHKIKEYFFLKRVAKLGYGEVSYITGADMMIRASDIERYRLFDPDYFMYFEETDLSNRYRKNGKKSVFVPQSHILHLEGKSFSFKEKRERMFFEGRKLYYQKNTSKLVHQCADFIYVLACMSRLLIYFLTLQRVKMREWYKRIALFMSI